MSGPVLCAWNLTVPERTQKRSQFPSNPNSLTLVGNKTTEGILLLNQKPICDDGWDIEAAHVACRQLGFGRAFQATQSNQANSDEFSLDDVKCRGNESSLLDCSHLVQRKENCNSGEAAGVVCDARSEAELKRFFFNFFYFVFLLEVRQNLKGWQSNGRRNVSPLGSYLVLS